MKSFNDLEVMPYPDHRQVCRQSPNCKDDEDQGRQSQGSGDRSSSRTKTKSNPPRDTSMRVCQKKVGSSTERARVDIAEQQLLRRKAALSVHHQQEASSHFQITTSQGCYTPARRRFRRRTTKRRSSPCEDEWRQSFDTLKQKKIAPTETSPLFEIVGLLDVLLLDELRPSPSSIEDNASLATYNTVDSLECTRRRKRRRLGPSSWLTSPSSAL